MIKELVLGPLFKLEQPASLIALREVAVALLCEIDLPEISTRTEFTNAFTHLTQAAAPADGLSISLRSTVGAGM